MNIHNIVMMMISTSHFESNNQYYGTEAEKKETAAILLSLSRSTDGVEYLVSSPMLKPQKTFYVPSVSIAESDYVDSPIINSSINPFSVYSSSGGQPYSPSPLSLSSDSNFSNFSSSVPTSPNMRYLSSSQDSTTTTTTTTTSTTNSSDEEKKRPPWIPITDCKYNNCLVCLRGPPSILHKCPTWSTIMRVVFYTLSNSFPERKFFNLRNDVYSWMVDHWNILLDFKKDNNINSSFFSFFIEEENNWRKQVQDMLSHSKNLFESGTEEYKQNGYWRLKLTMDTDPWTIKKPFRDKSKIAVKSKRSLSEGDLYTIKKAKLQSKVHTREELKSLAMNEPEIKFEIQSLNRIMNDVIQMFKNISVDFPFIGLNSRPLNLSPHQTPLPSPQLIQQSPHLLQQSPQLLQQSPQSLRPITSLLSSNSKTNDSKKVVKQRKQTKSPKQSKPKYSKKQNENIDFS
ncbi:hypothetical protein PPL_00536 [Heterostelium album PN500]|uniref:Uncharacterized protein n=1 Tax=Heterostelium pallidum (strain ATCC 26659 / Pp 5 / PN500) TaxID=670386 RepID=D3AWQ8_HETP5|nr:hypothetical protein PPL_00536 [Heterostelium album PN500]EFA86731.1 hypothetical protein PPL_00536 [Heterostelium album PN500]|eukprot:XP_020438835.1 hypothetical protein PPL_00536 [Heterostelium album PN500]